MRIRWDSPTQYMMHRGMEHSLKPALGNLRHEEVSEYKEVGAGRHPDPHKKLYGTACGCARQRAVTQRGDRQHGVGCRLRHVAGPVFPSIFSRCSTTGTDPMSSQHLQSLLTNCQHPMSTKRCSPPVAPAACAARSPHPTRFPSIFSRCFESHDCLGWII